MKIEKIKNKIGNTPLIQLKAIEEGLITIGISSGAALAAAIEVASREENKEKNIVIIFPDDATKYQSVLK